MISVNDGLKVFRYKSCVCRKKQHTLAIFLFRKDVFTVANGLLELPNRTTRSVTKTDLRMFRSFLTLRHDLQ